MSTLANKTNKKVNSNSLASSVKKDSKNPTMKKANNDFETLQSNLGNQAVQRLFESGQIQAKLVVSDPGDVYEQEADRVADEVLNMSDTQVQAKQVSGQNKPLNVQRKSTAGAQTQYVSSAVESKINSLQGGGHALSKETRAFFEPRFGHDFSEVRVHTNKNAHQLASSINARAFTYGRNIVFASNEYAPRTQQGQRLLSHELVHIIQQSGKRSSYIHRKDKTKDNNTLEQYTPAMNALLKGVLKLHVSQRYLSAFKKQLGVPKIIKFTKKHYILSGIAAGMGTGLLSYLMYKNKKIPHFMIGNVSSILKYKFKNNATVSIVPVYDWNIDPKKTNKGAMFYLKFNF